MRTGSVFDALKKTRPAIAATIALLLAMPLYAAQGDPTRPPTTTVTISVPSEKTRRPHWTLTSTLISEQRRTAVINDTVVSPGDHINGAKVISIKPSMVKLRIGKRNMTLVMLKKNVKSLSQAQSSGQGK